MLRGELKRIQQLAKKNAAKAAKEIAEMEKNEKSVEKKQKGFSGKDVEKLEVDEALENRDADKLFREMKEREF